MKPLILRLPEKATMVINFSHIILQLVIGFVVSFFALEFHL